MERQYRLDGLAVSVEIRKGLVCIVNDESFRCMLDRQLQMATTTPVAGIRTDHQTLVGRDLAIPDDSIIVEIWGHVYADYLLLKYSRILKYLLIFGLYARLRRSCAVIDCGERGKDPNRWVWNKLTPFKKMLGRRLATITLSRSTDG